jgi:hypothetical protein
MINDKGKLKGKQDDYMPDEELLTDKEDPED